MRAALGLIAAAAVGCGPPPPPELTCEAQPPRVTTAEVQAGVFDPVCKSCHFPNAAAPGDFTSAAATQQATVGVRSGYLGGPTGTLKVVDPGTPANSSLWLKVLGGEPDKRRGPNGEKVGDAMPLLADELDAQRLAQLKAWICSGANP